MNLLIDNHCLLFVCNYQVSYYLMTNLFVWNTGKINYIMTNDKTAFYWYYVPLENVLHYSNNLSKLAFIKAKLKVIVNFKQLPTRMLHTNLI